MGCIIATRALFTSGDKIIGTEWFSVSRQGVYDGLVISWRLFLIVTLSLLFISSTRSSEIKTAVQWFLKPIPFIPEKRVATMMSLIIRFIPLILNQFKETTAAQKARGVENRKNPLYRSVKLVLPVIRRIFETGDRLAMAMEARCYTEERTNFGLSAKPGDWLALSAVLVVCLLAVFFPVQDLFAKY
jgi:energy-coupling factor transporter transmembrane protein EcfT